MKKSIITVFLLALLFQPAVVSAQQKGAIGAGLLLGEPVSLTAKYWVSEYNAIDVGLGTGSKFTIYGDYLWQGWKAFPKPPEGTMAAHLGLGFKLRLDDKDDQFGVRTIAGVNYWMEKYPVEGFAQLIPFFELSPEGKFSLQLAVGVRYYFSGWN
ncbi:MAG: hypothetical protein ACE5FU_12680 [Nitrospinota bacterium]